MAKYIRYSEDEQRKIARRYLQLRIQGESWIEAINGSIQQVIEESRKKKIIKKQQITWLDGVVEEVKPFIESEAKTFEEESYLDLTTVPIETLISEVLHRYEDKLGEIVKTSLVSVLSSGDVSSYIKNVVLGSIASSLSPEIKQEIKTPHSHKEKKKRVLVIGVDSKQIASLDKTYQSILDMRYWNPATDGDATLKPKLNNTVDLVLVLTGGIGHRHDKIVSNSGVSFTRIPGDVSSIHPIISNFLKGEKVSTSS